MTTRLYRFQETYFWTESGLKLGIELLRPRVLRETPKGYWIVRLGFAKESDAGNTRYSRFVLKGRGKRFAHETEEWAWESFRRRKIWHRKHLERQLQQVNAALALIENGKPEIAAFSVTAKIFPDKETFLL